MQKYQGKIGFIPDVNFSLNTSMVELKPLDGIDGVVREINEQRGIFNDWCYPHIEENPKIAASWFRLPASHKIVLNCSLDCDHSDLELIIIRFLGFVLGLDLLPEGGGHYYRTPFKIGKLVNFSPKLHILKEFIDDGIHTILELNPYLQKCFFGVLNWFIIGQSYNHEFEKFDAQYKVFDALFNIEKTQNNWSNITHSRRIEKMCSGVLKIPTWASLSSNGASLISDLRNNLVHQALYNGSPIGFSYPDNNIVAQLKSLNERLILNFLGYKSTFSTPENIEDTWRTYYDIEKKM